MLSFQFPVCLCFDHLSLVVPPLVAAGGGVPPKKTKKKKKKMVMMMTKKKARVEDQVWEKEKKTNKKINTFSMLF